MVEYTCKWSVGDEFQDNGEIGTLTIDNNNILFNVRKHDFIVPVNFVGQYEGHKLKVYTYGRIGVTNDSYIYQVEKAVLYNGAISDLIGRTIENINYVSFTLPGLSRWLEMNGITCFYDETGLLTAKQVRLDPIFLSNSNPEIYILFRPNFPEAESDIQTSIILKNTPYIHINYSVAVDDKTVFNDIRKLMRFFSLLCGRMSYADDIILKKDGQPAYPIFYYINSDLSHNLKLNRYINRYRTNYQDISDKVPKLYSTWSTLSDDRNFLFLLNVYFYILGNANITIEDRFTTCCKFLEGYDLRRNNDEEKSDYLGEKLKELLKTDIAKELFKDTFKVVNSTYKPSSVADWIARGFLERIDLQSRLKRLNADFLKPLENNCKIILNSDATLDDFLSKIVKTRNYYSHFKKDATGLLSFSEMNYTIDVFETLILTILLFEIGFDTDTIKGIIKHDDAYWPWVHIDK